MFFKLELYPEALFQEVTEVHNNKSSAILQICKLLLFLHTSMSSTSLLEIKYQQQRFFCSSNLFYFNLKLQWNYLVVQDLSRICYDLFLSNRWWPLWSLGYWTCLHSCPKSKGVASSNTNLGSICWTHLSCWHFKVQKTKRGFETDPLTLDLVTPTVKRNMVDSLNW